MEDNEIQMKYNENQENFIHVQTTKPKRHFHKQDRNK